MARRSSPNPRGPDSPSRRQIIGFHLPSITWIAVYSGHRSRSARLGVRAVITSEGYFKVPTCRCREGRLCSRTGGPVSVPRLFRVIVPVGDIEVGTRFYSNVLGDPGRRISPGRHYFGCGGTILACFDPRADGDSWDARPNPDHLYLAVSDLEDSLVRVRAEPGSVVDRPIETQPWGERSFYCSDPFGNKLCFVDDQTLFTAGLL